MRKNVIKIIIGCSACLLLLVAVLLLYNWQNKEQKNGSDMDIEKEESTDDHGSQKENVLPEDELDEENAGVTANTDSSNSESTKSESAKSESAKSESSETESGKIEDTDRNDNTDVKPLPDDIF